MLVTAQAYKQAVSNALKGMIANAILSEKISEPLLMPESLPISRSISWLRLYKTELIVQYPPSVDMRRCFVKMDVSSINLDVIELEPPQGFSLGEPNVLLLVNPANDLQKASNQVLRHISSNEDDAVVTVEPLLEEL